MEHVRVEGLAELQRALRRADRNAPRALTRAGRKVGRIVVNGAQTRAAGVGRQQARAARDMRVAAQQRGASIKLRGPFALGAEYGAKRYRQFPPWRGNGAGGGYFLNPEIRARRDEISTTYAAEIVNEMRELG